MGDFEKVKRTVLLDVDKPLVTVRAAAFAFNGAFGALVGIDKWKWATLYYDNDDRRIGFKFHNDKNEPDKYTIGADGGKRGQAHQGRGRAIQANSVIRRHDWIRAVAGRKGTASAVSRRFEPEWDSIKGLWVIQLCPAFEKETKDRSQLPPAPGLYELVHANEVVYIGQSKNIHNRVASHIADGLVVDSIRYSIVNDQGERDLWEAEWLRRHESDHGMLPRYNAIGGKGRIRAVDAP